MAPVNEVLILNFQISDSSASHITSKIFHPIMMSRAVATHVNPPFAAILSIPLLNLWRPPSNLRGHKIIVTSVW